jgi:hypothetical protein
VAYRLIQAHVVDDHPIDRGAVGAARDRQRPAAEEAMELMIDLACHADGCSRSDDPREAAKFVVW